MKIPNFPLYYYDSGNVFWNKNNKQVFPFTAADNSIRYKLKNNKNKWVQIAKSTLEASVGNILKIPKTAKLIHNSNNTTYIDIDSSIYSFSPNFPTGKILKPILGTTGYMRVSITYKGKKRPCDIHKLMAETFILPNYRKQGLCCLHADDDKLNCHLTNLSVGTYSQNNLDSYKRGRNPGNGLKKT